MCDVRAPRPYVPREVKNKKIRLGSGVPTGRPWCPRHPKRMSTTFRTPEIFQTQTIGCPNGHPIISILCTSFSSSPEKAGRVFSILNDKNIETCHTWKKTPCQWDESYFFLIYAFLSRDDDSPRRVN